MDNKVRTPYQRRHSRWYERILLGLPFQLLVGLTLVVMLPSLWRWGWGFWEYLPSIRTNTLFAIGTSFVVIFFTLRRLIRFPGAHTSAYIIPTVTIVFLLAVAVLFFMRWGYTRQVLFSAYLLSMAWFFAGYLLGRRYRRLKLAVVPFGETLQLQGTERVELRWLEIPDVSGVRFDSIVADLRAKDLGPEWEKFLAQCTLSGIPVYHIRQIQESMTGRVQIEHLSENMFGSLLPSSIYSVCKRVMDLVGAVLLLPILSPLLLITAIAIKAESRGPVLFIQDRMGYRGVPFRVYKFRSMLLGQEGSGYTECVDDPRITRVGKVIRKYRIDELPQLLNIIKGEMSFIGPRPESMELSEWYEKEVAFFSYRHIVRPGISGWAQVEQGYAAQIDGMTAKLQYDFYYIKHFSLWIDVLIFFKTIKTILSGYGAR
ncbi:exopolysaccharide biosynthesis polyprenyl glycosylphosphotransferase [Halomonas sp. WWR20]